MQEVDYKKQKTFVPFHKVLSLAGEARVSTRDEITLRTGLSCMPTLPLVLALAALPGPVFLPGTQAQFSYTLGSSNRNSTEGRAGYVPKQEARVNGWLQSTPCCRVAEPGALTIASSCPCCLQSPILYAVSSFSKVSAALWDAVTPQAAWSGLWTMSLG